jgi:hypothetical protein
VFDDITKGKLFAMTGVEDSSEYGRMEPGGVTMKAVVFESELGPDHTLRVPSEVRERIPPGQPLRVLVLVPENGEDLAWEQLAAAEFGMGYADSDAIYDHLSKR